MPPRARAFAEFLIATFFALCMLVVAIASVHLDRPSGWPTAPGIFPLLVALAGFIFFAVIANSAFKVAWCELKSSVEPAPSQVKPFFLKSFVLVAGYYLLGTFWLPFEIATLLFLVVVQLTFPPKQRVSVVLMKSLALTFLISVCFAVVFNVVLPGRFEITGQLIHHLQRF
ncbi:MAG: tripartite tricarboxylate transporter TctB family protein [Pseudomonadota bacterium]